MHRRSATVALLSLFAVILVPVLLSGRSASAGTPAPAVSIGDAWAVEPTAGQTVPATFVLRLNQPATGTESVSWTTATGSASANDFTDASGVVAFAAGETQRSVSVDVLGDDRPEPNETFRVTLSAPVGLVLADASATGTIASDEGPRQLAVGDVAVLEGAPGTTRSAVFPVTASSPVLPGETVSVHFATANGTATAGSDYGSRTGVLTIPPGASSGTVAVPVYGDATVEPNERFSLVLSTPVGAVLADTTGTGTVRNDDGSVGAAPPPGLSVSDGWVVEGAPGQSRSAVFTISLPAPATTPVSAHWSTAYGSAGSGDLAPASGTVAIPVGGQSTTAAVPVNGDDGPEGNETFQLLLASPVGAGLSDPSGLGTVVDASGPLTVSVGDASLVEGNAGTSTLHVPVVLSAPVPAGRSVSMHYATPSGSAVSGSDYTATSGTLTIPAGAGSGSVDVPVVGDTAVEGDETFTATVSSIAGAVAADPTGTETILDDDGSSGPVEVAMSGTSVAENGGAATVAVSFSQPVPSDVNLSWSTSDGSATAGTDYVAQSDQTLTVPRGTTETTISVPVLDDTVVEPDETFTVALSAPSGFTVSSPPAMVTILDDSAAAPSPSRNVVAVGDIACAPTDTNFNGGEGVDNNCRQKATAALAQSLQPQDVLALGDLQYEKGELTNYQNSYDHSWGPLKSITHPAPGNHEYYTSGARGYFGYFVATDGGTVDPWYAFDLGSWRAIALNSNCSSIGGCGAGSPQETWLRSELATHPARCTVAYWHAPRFSSGPHGDDLLLDPIWKDLTAAGVDLVLSGHEHSYQRFAPMNAFGDASPWGMRQIVSGLGGRGTSNFPKPPRATSEVRSAAHPAVLQLTLRPDGYDWHEWPIAGETAPSDSGSSSCR